MAAPQIRPIRVEGNVAYVPLTQGYEAVIDAADVHLVEMQSWYALVVRRPDGSIRTVYAARKQRVSDGYKINVRMHRVIAGTPDGMETDHIDGNGLNNRRENLRHATVAQNRKNQRILQANKSGIKGVYWNKRRQKWLAQIRVDGRRIYLGQFASSDFAAKAYATASANLHGEFGRTA